MRRRETRVPVKGCACALCNGIRERRIAEIQAENAAAARSRVRCKRCGCTYANRCVLAVRDAAGELVMAGLCVPAGELEGHKCCSGCLTPELRVPFAAWEWAVDGEILMENPEAQVAAAIAKAREWLEAGSP